MNELDIAGAIGVLIAELIRQGASIEDAAAQISEVTDGENTQQIIARAAGLPR